MQTYFQRGSNGARYRITLDSLANYEAEGGAYDGCRDPGRLLASMLVEEHDGDCYGETDDLEAYHEIGMDPADVWLDAATGYVLIYDWPETAPLHARMVNS